MATPLPLPPPYLHRNKATQHTNPRRRLCILCADSCTPNRGFGSNTRKTDKKEKKLSSSQKSSTTSLYQAPGLSSSAGGKVKYASPDDLEFQQRLEQVRRSALAQKKAEEKQYGAIDYDAPAQATSSTDSVGLGTKIGVGVAVIVFGLVFSLGDFLPSGSTTKEVDIADEKISKEERADLEERLKKFEQTLAISPEDSTALEGAAVTLAEMREYKRAATLLENLCEKKANDPDVFRLLGEVKYALQDYEGSANAYRSASVASKSADFEVLRGLTNALLASKNPGQAVQVLLASREQLNKERSSDSDNMTVRSTTGTSSGVDPIQVDLLLGKAYADWGHISDAVSVYDQLIANHPDDFRGYLAKGILLKQNGSKGDAERIFLMVRNKFMGLDQCGAGFVMNSGIIKNLVCQLIEIGPKHNKTKAPAMQHQDAHSLIGDQLLSDNGSGGKHKNKIPRGLVAVYVGSEQRRFLVPVRFLSVPDFRIAMEMAAEEFGYEKEGGLRIPCDEHDFEQLLDKCHVALKSTPKSS
ncbi:hypothetical protein F511_33412 [Dorcoceras hygrometricum]|uniref:Uncharacterized protein n=1 Tax=Dorcoceras hygrometricum TaxID=472368 RepID=A0A2Z7C8E7_9LAMI|nr:hypothetical protein F511_33412 [Dorcoceras hygrometricum]